MIRPWTIARRRLLYEEAVAVIRNDFAEPLDVDLVARRVATSRRQLQRVFEEIGGTTVRRYLADTRLNIAAQLLHVRPDLSVREIGQAVGYHQPAQFAKAFRRVHDITPSAHRRMGLPVTGDGSADGASDGVRRSGRFDRHPEPAAIARTPQ